MSVEVLLLVGVDETDTSVAILVVFVLVLNCDPILLAVSDQVLGDGDGSIFVEAVSAFDKVVVDLHTFDELSLKIKAEVIS